MTLVKNSVITLVRWW